MCRLISVENIFLLNCMMLRTGQRNLKRLCCNKIMPDITTCRAITDVDKAKVALMFAVKRRFG
jgi:hypothetical protein